MTGRSPTPGGWLTAENGRRGGVAGGWRPRGGWVAARSGHRLRLTVGAIARAWRARSAARRCRWAAFGGHRRWRRGRRRSLSEGLLPDWLVPWGRFVAAGGACSGGGLVAAVSVVACGASIGAARGVTWRGGGHFVRLVRVFARPAGLRRAPPAWAAPVLSGCGCCAGGGGCDCARRFDAVGLWRGRLGEALRWRTGNGSDEFAGAGVRWRHRIAGGELQRRGAGRQPLDGSWLTRNAANTRRSGDSARRPSDRRDLETDVGTTRPRITAARSSGEARVTRMQIIARWRRIDARLQAASNGRETLVGGNSMQKMQRKIRPARWRETMDPSA